MMDKELQSSINLLRMNINMLRKNGGMSVTLLSHVGFAIHKLAKDIEPQLKRRGAVGVGLILMFDE